MIDWKKTKAHIYQNIKKKQETKSKVQYFSLLRDLQQRLKNLFHPHPLTPTHTLKIHDVFKIAEVRVLDFCFPHISFA